MKKELARQGENLVVQLRAITQAAANADGETAKAHDLFKQSLATFTALAGKHHPLVIELNDLSDKVGVIAVNSDPSTYL